MLLWNMTIFHLITPYILSNEIWTKLSKTLLVILQLRKKYRHKFYLSEACQGKLHGENKILIIYTTE